VELAGKTALKNRHQVRQSPRAQRPRRRSFYVEEPIGRLEAVRAQIEYRHVAAATASPAVARASRRRGPREVEWAGAWASALPSLLPATCSSVQLEVRSLPWRK
jgi:hypothetical protein